MAKTRKNIQTKPVAALLGSSITNIGQQLQIHKKVLPDKTTICGLYDTVEKRFVLLPTLFADMFLYPKSDNELWVESVSKTQDEASIYGVFDINLRSWLVPIGYETILHTTTPGKFEAWRNNTCYEVSTSLSA